MISLSIISMLVGSLSIDHQPVANQQVLVINPAADSIIYSGSTDDKGNFSWQYPKELDNSKVCLLAKFTTEKVVTAEYREVQLSRNAAIKINVDSKTLEDAQIELNGDSGIPKNFILRIDAESITGIPTHVNRYLSMSANNISGSFYDHGFDHPKLLLKIKRGVYRIKADFIVWERPTLSHPDFNNYIATRAQNKGKPLDGNEKNGFRIEITSAVMLTLKMRIVQDEEL